LHAVVLPASAYSEDSKKETVNACQRLYLKTAKGV